MNFFKNLIRELISEGHTVDIATNEEISPVDNSFKEWGCKVYPVSCTRSPLNKGTFKAISEIKRVVARNDYDIVHCHTPIAAMCTRLACGKFRKNGGKVYYTAHGFHFYKGASLKNWLMFYPIEKICSFFTDVLITINTEDFEFAKKHLNAQKTEYVQGVGIDAKHFADTVVQTEEKRAELQIPEDAILLTSVGELNDNKNHQIILQALAELKNENIFYIIAGVGEKDGELLYLAKELKLENNFKLLGYRKDIAEIYKASDICCFPSIREGLGLAAIEGMATGLPVVAAENRGTRDFCKNEVNGFLCSPFSTDEFACAINKIINNPELTKSISKNNTCAVKQFDISAINKKMYEFYGIQKQGEIYARN